MLSHSKSFKKYFFILSFFVLFGCSAPNRSAAQDTMIHIRTEYRQLIDLIGEDQNQIIAPLLSNWSDRVYDVTKYSNDEYLKAMDRLQVEYYKEIANYENIIKIDKEDRKRHSSKWLDALIDQFGRDYIINNRNAILDQIKLLFSERNEFYYRNISEKLFFKEAVLYGAYRAYFNLFLNYYDTLSQEDKNRLNSRKEAVDAFLASLNKSSVALFLTAYSNPYHMLSVVRTEGTNNKELSSFFDKFSDLRFFDIIKCSKELSRITYK